MSLKHLHAIIAMMVVCLFAGCHADINLNDIDKKADLDMGLALPIGNLHLKIGDFLGADKIENLYVEKGIFTWKKSFPVARPYTEFDLKKYIPDVNMPLLNVYDELKSKFPFLPATGITIPPIPIDTTITIPFNLTLKLDGINHPDSVGKQRIDSAVIDSANFVSTIKLTNGLPLDWNWIDRISLDLSDHFHRADGQKELVVYDKNDPKFSKYTDFGQAMDTKIHDFSIVLMKNTDPKDFYDYLNNVVDSLVLTVKFSFTIPKNTPVTIPPDAGFDYHMTVQFLDYKAIWGMLEPGSQMSDEDVIDLSESWVDLEFLTRANVPFSNPRIRVDIDTKIAGAMQIKDAYVYAININNETTYAAFGDKEEQTVTKNLENWLSVRDSKPGDSTTMHVDFDSTAVNGRIHRMFRGVPEKLGYRFNIRFNPDIYNQIRLVKDMSIKVNATATMPLDFQDSLHVDYTDTIQDVNLSQYSIDSLEAKSEVIESLKTTNVTLFVTAYNTIPMDIKAKLICLDEKKDTIWDPEDSTKVFSLFAEDYLTFAAPQFEYIGGNWQRTSEGKTIITANLTKQKLNMLPNVKYILYTLVLDNQSLQDEYDSKQGFTAKITEDCGVTLKIGLTAEAGAILNFN